MPDEKEQVITEVKDVLQPLLLGEELWRSPINPDQCRIGEDGILVHQDVMKSLFLDGYLRGELEPLWTSKDITHEGIVKAQQLGLKEKTNMDLALYSALSEQGWTLRKELKEFDPDPVINDEKHERAEREGFYITEDGEEFFLGALTEDSETWISEEEDEDGEIIMAPYAANESVLCDEVNIKIGDEIFETVKDVMNYLDEKFEAIPDSECQCLLWRVG